MFGIGGGEFLVIALVALIAVGPEQLPSVMRKFGGYVAQVRSMADGVRSEFMSGMDEVDPVKWTGDGSNDKPIVPRGFAETSSGAAGVAAAESMVEPLADNESAGEGSMPPATPSADTDTDTANNDTANNDTDTADTDTADTDTADTAVAADAPQKPPAS